MFEASWIDELSATEAADELARARDLVLVAEATQFLLAAHWADLHALRPGRGHATLAAGDAQRSAADRTGARKTRGVRRGRARVLLALAGRPPASRAPAQLDAGTTPSGRCRPPSPGRLREGEVRGPGARGPRRGPAPGGVARWVDEQRRRCPQALPRPGDAKIAEADPDAPEERARVAVARPVRPSGRTERTACARSGPRRGGRRLPRRGARSAGRDPRRRRRPPATEVLRADALRSLSNPGGRSPCSSEPSSTADPAVEPADELCDDARFLRIRSVAARGPRSAGGRRRVRGSRQRSSTATT